jgi:prophage antirepressor-like protein
MKMNELQVFENPEFGEIRTVQIDGEPWFVAVDVCNALGLLNMLL